MSYEATYTLNCLVFEKMAKNWFWRTERPKISFWRFSQKVSILRYMLLHNITINMVIANILHHQESLYDYQGPRNINYDTLITHKWAWPIFKGSNFEFGLMTFYSYSGPPWGQLCLGLLMLSPRTIQKFRAHQKSAFIKHPWIPLTSYYFITTSSLPHHFENIHIYPNLIPSITILQI